MQAAMFNSYNVWMILSSVIFVMIVAFGTKVYNAWIRANRKHHYITLNDHAIEDIYTWDDDDDI